MSRAQNGTAKDLPRLQLAGRLYTRQDRSPKQTQFATHGGLLCQTTVVFATEMDKFGQTIDFVKFYLCQSDDHARALEAYFKHQATVLREAVRAVGENPSPIAVGDVESLSTITNERATMYGQAGRAWSSKEEELNGFLDGAARLPIHPSKIVVVSARFLEPLKWREQSALNPNVLAQLEPIARTIDTLHAGWGGESRAAHCDIKPSNVCRDGDRWVLADTDAVVSWSLYESFVRFPGRVTPFFAGSRIIEALRASSEGLDPEVIVSNDRCGFFALVLSALFGAECAEQLFTDSHGRRPVDRSSEFGEHLTRVLRGSGQEGLIGHKQYERLVQALSDIVDGMDSENESTCTEMLAHVSESLEYRHFESAPDEDQFGQIRRRARQEGPGHGVKRVELELNKALRDEAHRAFMSVFRPGAVVAGVLLLVLLFGALKGS